MPANSARRLFFFCIFPYFREGLKIKKVNNSIPNTHKPCGPDNFDFVGGKVGLLFRILAQRWVSFGTFETRYYLLLLIFRWRSGPSSMGCLLPKAALRGIRAFQA